MSSFGIGWQPGEEGLQSLQSFIDLLLRGCIGDPDVLAGSKGRARHQGQARFVKKSVGKCSRVGQAFSSQVGGNIRINVEGPQRTRASNARYRAQTGDDPLPAPI